MEEEEEGKEFPSIRRPGPRISHSKGTEDAKVARRWKLSMNRRTADALEHLNDGVRRQQREGWKKRGDLGSRRGGTYQPEARSDPADVGDNDDESKPGAPADCTASSGGSAQAEEGETTTRSMKKISFRLRSFPLRRGNC